MYHYDSVTANNMSTCPFERKNAHTIQTSDHLLYNTLLGTMIHTRQHDTNDLLLSVCIMLTSSQGKACISMCVYSFLSKPQTQDSEEKGGGGGE